MGSSLPTYQREPSYGKQRSTADTPPPAEGSWSLTMSFSQACVMWSVIAGTVVMAFLFGMYAGREQGISSALEEYRGQSVRIELAEPIAANQNSEEALAALDELGKQAKQADTEDTSSDSAEAAFDFSQEGKISLAAQSTANDTKTAAPSKDKTAKRSEESEAQSKPATVKKPQQPKATEVARQNTAAEPGGELVKLGTPRAGWYVQVAANRSHAKASVIFRQYAAAGFAAVLEQATVRGQNYFRVIIGPYVERAEALTAKTKIQSSGISRAEPFLKRVR